MSMDFDTGMNINMNMNMEMEMALKSDKLSGAEQLRLREQWQMQQSEVQSPDRHKTRRTVLAALEQDDTSGYTPLHFASSSGNYECMLLLLSCVSCRGASKENNSIQNATAPRTSVVDIPDARGRSALHLAALYG